MNPTLGTPELIAAGVAFLLLIVLATFLRQRRPRGSARPVPEFQDVFIGIINGSYQPSGVVLKRGTPAKLRVHRDGAAGEDLVVEGLASTRKLPEHKTTTIDISPDRAGVFAVRSRDGVVRAHIVVVGEQQKSPVSRR